ncbi:glycosyltransferase family A protein [Streptomyces syringium]|uniref:glycosyltransferase family A protein n=1 Tax=Streptomyces syringium TaxID=76729 RepID=UPI003454108E
MTCPDPVTVVVAARGTGALPGLFANLAVQTYLGEINVVVVDHGPRPVIDATALRRWWVPTQVVHEPRPALSHAHNRGIEAATGQWARGGDQRHASCLLLHHLVSQHLFLLDHGEDHQQHPKLRDRGADRTKPA